jgi:restriction endonuclease S subunit
MSSFTNLSNWQNLKLGEICLTKKGSLSSKTASIFLDGNIPFIKAKDIHFDTVYSSHKKLSYEIVEKLGIEIVPRKSILITVSGPNAGSIAILGIEAIVENNIYYSIANFNIIDPEYLFYYLCFTIVR